MPEYDQIDKHLITKYRQIESIFYIINLLTNKYNYV